tara:strand:+ start:2068 stop:7599 length:5532 start_codon:yes stop_codon:yes gene_type:complete
MADLTQQLQLERDINAALVERNKLLAEQNKTLSTQSNLASNLASSLGSSRSTRNVRSMTSALRNSSDALKDSNDAAKELEDSLNEAADAAEEASSGFSVLGEVFGSLGSIFSGGISIIKNVASAVLSIAASLAKTAFALFTFPFKLFGSLVEMSQEGSAGRPIAEAMEELRDVMGDLASGPGKSVRDTFNKIRHSGKSLAGTGLTIRNVYGYGRDGIAALLKDLTELAAAAGDNFYRLQKHFETMGDKAIIFQRGLGVSKEEFSELMGIAEARGEDPEKFLTRFSKTAVRTAKRFGMGVKDMAKGMKELTQDVENFGHLGPKAFAPITAYARKLGLEIKDMANIMQSFAGFSDTVEAASQMAQQFQMNVDAVELMSAQNPAEKIDIIRKSFFRAGHNLKDFNYQQRMYLAQITRMPAKSLDAAFALDKQGISYSQIAAEAEDAEKKQMSQKEVLKELQKGIKRLIEVLDMPKVKGFFDAFVKGFERGIMRSQEFRKVLRSIRRGLQMMFRFGEKVGRMFVKFFPGIKTMLDGIAEFFEPQKFRQFERAVKPIFEAFFKGEMTFKQLMNTITGSLDDQFGLGGTGVGKIVKGFGDFATAVAKFIGGVLEYVFDTIKDKVAPFMNSLILEAEGYLKTGEAKTNVGALFKALFKNIDASGAGKRFLSILEPITSVFGPDGSFMQMIEAMSDPTKKLFGMLGEDAYNLGVVIGCGIWEGITKVWNDTSFWEKLGWGALGLTLLAPRSMLFLGKHIAKGAFKATAWAFTKGTPTLYRGAQMAWAGTMSRIMGPKNPYAGKTAVEAAKSARTMAMQRMVKDGTMTTKQMQKAANRVYQDVYKKVDKQINQTAQKVATESAKKLTKSVTGQATRTATGMVTRTLSVGSKILKGALSKGIPFLFDIGYGLYEAYNAKKGEGGQRFLSGVVSSLTFGAWSTDEVQDAFFSTNKVVEKLARDTHGSIEKYQNRMYKHFAGLARNHNNVYRGLIAESNELATGIAQVSAILGDNMTEQQKKIFGMMSASADVADSTVRSLKKNQDDRIKLATEASGFLFKLKEDIDRELGEWDTDQVAGFGAKKIKDYLGLTQIRTLQRAGVQFIGDIITIPEAVVEEMGPGKKFHKIYKIIADAILSENGVESLKKEMEHNAKDAHNQALKDGWTVEQLAEAIITGKKTGVNVSAMEKRLEDTIKSYTLAGLPQKMYEMIRFAASAPTPEEIKAYGTTQRDVDFWLKYAGIQTPGDPDFMKFSKLFESEIAKKVKAKVKSQQHIIDQVVQNAEEATFVAEGRGGARWEGKAGEMLKKSKDVIKHLTDALSTGEYVGTGKDALGLRRGQRFNLKTNVKMRKRVQYQLAKYKEFAGTLTKSIETERNRITTEVTTNAKKAVEKETKRLYGVEDMDSALGMWMISLESDIPPSVKGRLKNLWVQGRIKEYKELLGEQDKVTPEQAQKAKLTKLEQQRQTVLRIEQLSDIPNQLKRAQKALSRMKPAIVEKQATELFKKALGIGEAIGKAIDASEIGEFATKKLDEGAGLKGVQAVNNVITPAANALENIASSVRKLKSVIDKNLKFFRRLDLACLMCDLYDMTSKIAKIPAALAKGVMPLTTEAEAAAAAEMNTTVPTQDEAQKLPPMKMSEAIAWIDKAMDNLSNITHAVGKITTHLSLLQSEIKDINGMKLTIIGKKKLSQIKSFADGGSTLLTKMVAIFNEKKIDTEATGKKLDGAIKNMEKVKKFFKTAKSTIREAKVSQADIKKFKSTASDYAKAINQIASAGRRLSGKGTAVVESISAAKNGGTVNIKHYMDGINMKVYVTIDAGKLGNAIGKVPLTAGKDAKYMEVGAEAGIKKEEKAP